MEGDYDTDDETATEETTEPEEDRNDYDYDSEGSTQPAEESYYDYETEEITVPEGAENYDTDSETEAISTTTAEVRSYVPDTDTEGNTILEENTDPEEERNSYHDHETVENPIYVTERANGAEATGFGNIRLLTLAGTVSWISRLRF